MGETCVDGVLAEGKLGHVYSIAGKFLDRQGSASLGIVGCHAVLPAALHC